MRGESVIGSNKVIHFFIIIAYYLAVVLPHVLVGEAISDLFKGIGRRNYNITIAVLSFSGLGIGLAILAKRINNHEDKGRILSYIIFSFVAVIICFTILFVTNIEAIHFVQYALLAILLFPLLKNCRDTISVSVLLGALDELYQYLVLDTSAPYFDFNDVFFDTLGAGFGLLYLKIIGLPTSHRTSRKWWQKLEVKIMLTVSGLLLLLYALGLFSVNPGQEGPLFFTLFKEVSDGFWTYPGGPHARLYVLTPIPGLMLIFLTAYVYGRLDRLKPLVENS